MIWLVVQMWFLLLGAFLLGLGSGWWIWNKKRKQQLSNQTIYQLASAPNEDDDLSHRSVENAFVELGEPLVDQNHSRAMVHEKPSRDKNVDEATLSEPAIEVEDFTIESSIQEFDTPQTIMDQIHTDNDKKQETAKPQIESNLLSSPMQGSADDLQKIKGIGPTLEKLLNSFGVYNFSQIADWSEDEVTWIDSKLRFPGRIKRENWIEQAKKMRDGESTEFSEKYKKRETLSSGKSRKK